VSEISDLLDKNGMIVDENSLRHVKTFVDAFAAWIA
jgi:hypothetical protein